MSGAVTPHQTQATTGTYKVELSEKPCAVRFVEHFGGFVVGTYDCLPDIASVRARFPDLSEAEAVVLYEETNHRIGSLNFLSNQTTTHSGEVGAPYKLQVASQCKHGGIFDMDIAGDEIYAAHANGFVARYSFDRVAFRSLESIKVTSKPGALLTSLDTCDLDGDDGLREPFLSLVGDSNGRVTLVRGRSLEEVIAHCDITADADPVWQVKFVPVAGRAGGCASSSILPVVVAAEDSSWYIYALTLGQTSTKATFQRIHRNEDFRAGVTSICFLPATTNTERREFGLLLGSYDESLRHYNCRLVAASAEARSIAVEVESKLDSPIVIEGGGIWRLNRVAPAASSAGAAAGRLYIAAMYAGSYRLELGALDSGAGAAMCACVRLAELGVSGEGGNSMAPLHYGIDLARRDALACIVDYNNNCCIFVEQDDS